ERERVHELERARGRQRLHGLDAARLSGREANHRAHSLPADGERIADRLRLAVQLGPEPKLVQPLLCERAKLVRISGHPPPPHASRARAPLRRTSRAPRARRGSRAPGRASCSRRTRAGRARPAPPRDAPVIPPLAAGAHPYCSCPAPGAGKAGASALGELRQAYAHAASLLMRSRMPFTSLPASLVEYCLASVTASSITAP